MRVLALPALLTLVMLGCAQIQSDLSVYHNLPTGVAGKTFFIRPMKEQEDSLEWKAHRDLIARSLYSKGMREGTIDDATVTFLFSYFIDKGRDRTAHMPTFGQTGSTPTAIYGTATTYGNTTNFNASVISTPTYGITGSIPITQTQYTRMLLVTGWVRGNGGKAEKVFEGTATSRGGSGNINEIVPKMIECMFEDFPGKNGRSWPCIKNVS